MFDKFNHLRRQLPYLPRTFALVWAAAPRWTFAWLGLLIGQGLLPVFTVYLTRTLVDALSATLHAGGDWQTFRQPGLWVALLVLVTLTNEGLRSVASWVRAMQAELVQDHINNLIHTKALALDLAFYETPEYYDRLHRAKVDALNRPVALLENVGNVLQGSLTFVAMAGVLLTFGWWLPVVLLLGTLPALGVIAEHTIHEHAWRQRTTTIRRSATYYDWLMIDSNAVAELRLFNLGDYFRQAYRTIRQQLHQESFLLTRRQVLAEFFASAIALCTSGLVMGWMVWRAVHGTVSLGKLAMFYQAFNQGQQLMHTLLGGVGQIYSNLLFLDNLFEFLAIEPQLTAPATPRPMPSPLREGICFQSITFRYPHSERIALQNFNLTIPAGQVVAIVGENGAGKSTLLKLLCRLYDPQAGQVTIDGIDLRDFSPLALQQCITVLFQQPVRYHLTARENIALGDLAAKPTLDVVQRAAEAAAADIPIARLPKGYETILGKWFGGAELSGGEWQRVALARAFLRRAPIMILDEPTSAMDAWTEADWMARFRSLVTTPGGRSTVLIITHRFTTAMQADMIHVMAEGQITESGNHTQLLCNNGRYAQSWRQQMEGTPPVTNQLAQSSRGPE